MSFVIDVQKLRDKAAQRLASPATPATLQPGPAPAKPDTGSEVATVAPGVMSRWSGSAWDDAEIDAFSARRDRLMRWGYNEERAEALAERLTVRDRDADDRRMCFECSNLGESGRCIAAATGRLPRVDRRLEPVQTILQRCEAFGLRKGLA